MNLGASDYTVLALLIPGLLLAWAAAIVIYRLAFHPLARFPGPKLAAITHLYEVYYDVWLGGQYTFKLRELHQRYGPVVRLNPDDLHFNDPEFYDDIFCVTSGKSEKPFKTANAFGGYPAVIGTTDHDLHKLRRSALNPFFSKRSVNDICPFLIPIVGKFCSRLEEAAKKQEHVNLKYAYAALTMDNIAEYCFSKTPDRVLLPDFDKVGFDNIDSFIDTSLINIYFPWLLGWLYKIPENLLKRLLPALSGIVGAREALAHQIEAIRDGQDHSFKTSGHRTILHDLLESDLPKQEKSRNRLRDEAFSLVTAGSGTTAHTCKCTTYYIQADSGVYSKLMQELRTIMPTRETVPKLTDLEKLPYLTACVLEGLRLSHAVTHRACRAFPYKTLEYKGQKIPPKTIVCSTALLLHENPDTFPDPLIYRPERWLVSAAEKQRLQRHLVVFSRGARGCLGMNLAMAELYLILAIVFRRFEFDIGKVQKGRDIDVDRDMIIAQPRKDSPGMIVKVNRIVE
ncbi:MAG: hypothetical protein M1820_006122 [Bogoriella megaspora]|nr:MAG: hypothetical protein M1820_006122 [Bogoriella megaspora]